MNKLEVIQKKLKELRLYREYLLKFKMLHSLNHIEDKNKGLQKKKYKA